MLLHSFSMANFFLNYWNYKRKLPCIRHQINHSFAIPTNIVVYSWLTSLEKKTSQFRNLYCYFSKFVNVISASWLSNQYMYLFVYIYNSPTMTSLGLTMQVAITLCLFIVIDHILIKIKMFLSDSIKSLLGFFLVLQQNPSPEKDDSSCIC